MIESTNASKSQDVVAIDKNGMTGRESKFFGGGGGPGFVLLAGPHLCFRPFIHLSCGRLVTEQTCLSCGACSTPLQRTYYYLEQERCSGLV